MRRRQTPTPDQKKIDFHTINSGYNLFSVTYTFILGSFDLEDPKRKYRRVHNSGIHISLYIVELKSRKGSLFYFNIDFHVFFFSLLTTPFFDLLKRPLSRLVLTHTPYTHPFLIDGLSSTGP